MEEEFFLNPREQSKIKSAIVSEYFSAWSNIIQSSTRELAFVDLYSGPGQYDDETVSTPLLIIREVLSNPKVIDKALFIFNDKSATETLKKNIEEIENVSIVIKKIEFLNNEVNDEIINELKHIETIPSLFFLDPWGYKGVSLNLIKFSIKPWGSECIFFFNYNRIQAAINNPQVQNLMINLFGGKRLEELRKKTINLNATDKELEIINILSEALKDFGGKFCLPFCFKHAEKDRTSHYLIFVGKHPKGYSLIKEIMAKYSQKDSDGVPSFTYDPKKNIQLEFTFNRPLKELSDALLQEFTGKSIEFKKIYEEHNLKTRFIRKNYQDVLNLLEEQGKIAIDKPRSKRIIGGKLTLGDKRVINFP